MKKRLLLIIAVLCVASSAWAGECPEVAVQTDLSPDQFTGQPWCRHRALVAAVIYAEYYPVRFRIGPIKCGGSHVQAQAFIKGEWKWLRMDSQNRPYVGEQEDFFTPDKTMTLDEWIAKERKTFGWTSDEAGIPTIQAEYRRVQNVQVHMLFGSGATSFRVWKDVNSGDMDRRYPPPGPNGRLPWAGEP